MKAKAKIEVCFTVSEVAADWLEQVVPHFIATTWIMDN